MKINTLYALLIFVIAFVLRTPLVDRLYQYSFEPDSESCVEVTRSFYFFFKSPSVQNSPQTLSTYPNYSDGDFIACAVIGNIVRPLCKAGIITAPLADSDNSLVIYSMRWGGVWFDALAAVIAFLVFVMLTGNSFISLLVTLLYYLLNQQTLNIDLIRIDHFGLFAANLTMLAAILLFRNPGKKRYYMLSGIAAGLVTGTKINFPFYLLILLVVFCYLVYCKKVALKNFILLVISFLAATAFMYQRWLMYPENIPEVIRFTLNNGKVWTAFWGNDNYRYYLWDEFFNHGFSGVVAVLLIAGYLSFFLGSLVAWLKKDPLRLILCLTFAAQSIALMFSPKIGRYGIIMPLWMGAFLAYGVCYILQYTWPGTLRALVYLAFVLFLWPVFSYALKDYNALKQKVPLRQTSILQTRVPSYQWITKNLPAGSILAIQHPRVSNPPIYDEPYVLDENYLKLPFLFKDEVSKFYPPDTALLQQKVNYMITSDKETNYHFYILNLYHCDSSLIAQWHQFYNLLDTFYPCQKFSSNYDNYGVKSFRVYEINKTPLGNVMEINNCRAVAGSMVSLNWDVTANTFVYDYSFQVQIADDSAFRWLVSGSRDGFPSRYSSAGRPGCCGRR